MTDEQNTAKEGKKFDITKLVIILIAVSAAVIIGTLLAVYFTSASQASSPVTDGVTSEDAEGGSPTDEATEPYPDSAFTVAPARSDQFGRCEGYNVVIVQIPSLCTELMSKELTPNFFKLCEEGAYFSNVIVPSYDPSDLRGVINTGVPAGRYGSGTEIYANVPGLSDLLGKQGYETHLYSYAHANNSASVSLYDEAIADLGDGKFFMHVVEGISEYPYFSSDGQLLSALQEADARLGKFISALHDKGLYDKTVVVAVGSGLRDQDSFGGLDVKKRLTAPLVIKGAAVGSSGALASHTDVAPVLLDLLGTDGSRLFYTGIDLLCEERETVYLQTVFERGSYVDEGHVIMADSTATPKLSRAYNIEKDRTGAASTYRTGITGSVEFYEELDLALSYGLPALVFEKGREDAIREYEMNKKDTEVKKASRVEDVFPENESSDFYKNDVNLFNRAKMLSANEFDGYFDGVMFKYDGLTLRPGVTEGEFISSDIELGEFSQLIASWNASTAGGTVEISVCAKRADGTYTDPYSWGVWSAIPGVSASASRSDKDGVLDIDTLQLKNKSTAVRLIIKLKQTGEKAPVLYNVTLAADTAKGALTKTPASKSVKLTVKRRYQMDVPDIGGRICSPTSLSMVRDYYGEKKFETKDTADGVYDNGEDIYGNWSYNVAYAGELGYNAYVDIYDMNALKWALYKQVPVVCSVKIKKGQLAGSGYPDYSTNGHLMCVIGYETVDGVDWLIVNDPAKQQVEVRYLCSEFEQIWRGTVYIVQQRPDRYTWRIGEGTDQDILVVADYVPEGRYNRPGGNYKVKYIVIHNTGNFSRGADAMAHRNYVKQDGTQTSWHYTVDDHSIYKHLPEYERAWHAGDGREGQGNTYGIGIEICVNYETLGTKKPTEYFYKSLDNAAQLVAELMYEYKLSIKAVRQHNHFSGKNCPQVIRENDLWEPFLDNIQARYDKLVEERGKP